MAQLATVNVDKNWVALTPEDDTTYYIQNRGGDFLIALEGDNSPAPDEASTEGVVVPPYKTLVYKKGSQADLWLRAYSTKCEVNVSTEA